MSMHERRKGLSMQEATLTPLLLWLHLSSKKLHSFLHESPLLGSQHDLFTHTLLNVRVLPRLNRLPGRAFHISDFFFHECKLALDIPNLRCKVVFGFYDKYKYT